jgi:hypothetical protein
MAWQETQGRPWTVAGLPVTPMPINHLLKERHSFGPDEIKVLATAFDAALLELGLGRTDTAALLVAKRIVALAQGGECDPRAPSTPTRSASRLLPTTRSLRLSNITTSFSPTVMVRRAPRAVVRVPALRRDALKAEFAGMFGHAEAPFGPARTQAMRAAGTDLFSRPGRPPPARRHDHSGPQGKSEDQPHAKQNVVRSRCRARFTGG